jgi:predicted glutamine amidotransferase
MSAEQGESYLNTVVTDGSSGVVSRYSTLGSEPPSLFVRDGSQFACKDEVCRMLRRADHASAIVVASEPLTDEAEWQAVPTRPDDPGDEATGQAGSAKNATKRPG